MKRLFSSVALMFAAVLMAATSQAEERPVLRSQVSTISDIVTVGDFYTNAGAHASAPLFRSPDLGTSGDVPAHLVAKRAIAAGLAGAGTDGLRSVVVHRQAQDYDTERIIELARNALAAKDALVEPDDLDITLLQSPRSIQANPAADEPIKVERVLWSRNDGRFSVYINVAMQSGTRQITLTGVAHELIEVAALIQPLRRGAILKPQDLTVVKLARSRVPARAILDGEELVGLAARNSLRANSPITRNDFERPLLIPRGDKVTLTYRLGGMKLSTRGQAMDDGARGDVIDIMNLESRRIVSAVVISRGQVQVQTPGSRIASLNESTSQ